MKKVKEKVNSSELLRRFFEDNGGQLKKIAVLAILIIVAFGGFAFNEYKESAEMFSDSGQSEVEVIENTEESEGDGQTEETEVNDAGTIFVDIGGAVKRPMLAELPAGSRVEDAIESAGGTTEEADLTNINRAEFINDGDKIYIPAYMTDDDGNLISETAGTGSAIVGSAGASVSGKVNINTADSEQLQTLSGVGPSTAQKIIDYRSANGQFGSVEDIKNVSGIGDKTYEKLKEYITT